MLEGASVTSRLNVMKRQANPDGKAGHFERSRMQQANKNLPPKKKFTGTVSKQHNFTIMKELKLNKKTQWNEENIRFAIEFCRTLCKEDCPLNGQSLKERRGVSP